MIESLTTTSIPWPLSNLCSLLYKFQQSKTLSRRASSRLELSAEPEPTPTRDTEQRLQWNFEVGNLVRNDVSVGRQCLPQQTQGEYRTVLGEGLRLPI